MQITVERTVNGILVLSAMIGGYLVRRKYIGYTVKEARREFRAECR
jgi:hypothetical protein